MNCFGNSSKDTDDKLYQLMNKNDTVLIFIKRKTLLNSYEVSKVVNKSKLPYLLKNDLNLLETWINNRAIPTNREHLDNVLASLSLNSKDKFELLAINHAASLNDTFWIKELNELNVTGGDVNWDDVNLYKGFKEHLGIITFFGNISSLSGSFKTPEITTQGMLRKAWRNIDNKIFMYKANTHGFANTGNEMYSEVLAYEIGKILEIPIIKYEYAKWNSMDCVHSKLFTSEKLGYLTMNEFLSANLGSKRIWTYKDLEELLPENIMQQINDMIIFDFLIENEDRHFSNFGLLVDNDNMSIKALAPLFDHGYSLLHFEMEKDLTKWDYNKSFTGTFNLKNKYQAISILNIDSRRYKHWANILMNNIDNLDFKKVPHYRKVAIKKLLINRCKFIQEF